MGQRSRGDFTHVYFVYKKELTFERIDFFREMCYDRWAGAFELRMIRRKQNVICTVPSLGTGGKLESNTKRNQRIQAFAAVHSRNGSYIICGQRDLYESAGEQNFAAA